MKYLSLFCAFLLISCAKNAEFYTLDDFEKVDKIDTHIHINTGRDAFVEQSRRDGFKLLNIVVDSRDEAHVTKQYVNGLDQKRRNGDDLELATAFSMATWDSANWLDNTLAKLKSDFNDGAISMKVWKNIGMEFRDKNGKLVMLDDPKFDPIFKMLTDRGIPMVGHLGEPKNCWLPLDEMTTTNDQSYFSNNPKYHMYKHPELPSYEEQIAARDRVLDNNPNLVFVGAHAGSLEWSVDLLAEHLDKYPNFAVDIAARIGQLFYQTKEDRERVRNFFLKYQDRIIYATDMGDNGERDITNMQKGMHETWIRDWQYFVTDDMMTSDLIRGQFQGVQLPRGVVDKIYNQNARKWFKMFQNEPK